MLAITGSGRYDRHDGTQSRDCIFPVNLPRIASVRVSQGASLPDDCADRPVTIPALVNRAGGNRFVFLPTQVGTRVVTFNMLGLKAGRSGR
jgi:hypothetical protein